MPCVRWLSGIEVIFGKGAGGKIVENINCPSAIYIERRSWWMLLYFINTEPEEGFG